MKILLFLLLLAITPTITLAVTEPEASPSSSKNNNLEEIQKIREVVQQKVKEKLLQIGSPITAQPSGPRAFMGTVASIGDNKITIEYQNTKRDMTVDDKTVFIDAKRNKTNLENIKPGQDILVLGFYGDDNQFSAKRIIIVSIKEIENNKQVVSGKIVDISKSSPIFVLIPNKNKDTQYQIKTDLKTEILDTNNKKLDSSKLAPGQKIIVVIEPDEKIAKTFYATKIINQETPVTTPTTAPSP